MQNQENRKKRQWIILAAVLVILAAAAGLFLTFGTRRENPDGKGIVLEEGAEDWDGEMKDMSEGQTGIKIPGYGEITVPAGETTPEDTGDLPRGEPHREIPQHCLAAISGCDVTQFNQAIFSPFGSAEDR